MSTPVGPVRAGFIGLGAMGAPMAGHLHSRGLLCVVGNRSPARSQAFAAAHEGVRVADSADDFRDCNCDALRSSRCDVMAAWHAAAVLAPGSIVMTRHVASHGRRRPAICSARTASLSQAPVSGGSRGAQRHAINHGRGQPATLQQAVPAGGYALRITHMVPRRTATRINRSGAFIAQAFCEGLAWAKTGLRADLLCRRCLQRRRQLFLDKRGTTILADIFDPDSSPPCCSRTCASSSRWRAMQASVTP